MTCKNVLSYVLFCHWRSCRSKCNFSFQSAYLIVLVLQLILIWGSALSEFVLNPRNVCSLGIKKMSPSNWCLWHQSSSCTLIKMTQEHLKNLFCQLLCCLHKASSLSLWGRLIYKTTHDILQLAAQRHCFQRQVINQADFTTSTLDQSCTYVLVSERFCRVSVFHGSFHRIITSWLSVPLVFLASVLA